MQSKYALVLTTTATEEHAAQLARELVEMGLGACVQVRSLRSIYRWKGELHDEPEWQLAIKTRAAKYAEIEHFIKTHHAYETPEIVRIDIADGSQDYLRWIDECTK